MIKTFITCIAIAAVLSVAAVVAAKLEKPPKKSTLAASTSTVQPASLTGFTTNYYLNSGNFSLKIADSGFWVPIDTFASTAIDTMYNVTSVTYSDSNYDKNANITSMGVVQLTGNARTAENTYTLAVQGVNNYFQSSSTYSGSIIARYPLGYWIPYQQVKAYNSGWDGWYFVNNDVGTYSKYRHTGRYVTLLGTWVTVPGMSRVMNPIYRNAIMSK